MTLVDAKERWRVVYRTVKHQPNYTVWAEFDVRQRAWDEAVALGKVPGVESVRLELIEYRMVAESDYVKNWDWITSDYKPNPDLPL